MQEENIITIQGKFQYILFRNEENFYTVAKFKLHDEKERTITVNGNIVNEPEKDVLYILSGLYVEHPKYGLQFQLKTYEKAFPISGDGVVKYLSSSQFPGIGPKTAQKIVTLLGKDCLLEIKKDPNILLTVPGLTPKNIQSIQEGIENNKDGLEELVQFLSIHGIGIRNLMRLNRTYGKDALQKVKENPYRVIEECDGFGFETADKIAMSLGFSKEDPRRILAYLISLTMELCVRYGDSFVTYETLLQNFEKAMNGIEYDFDSLLQEAILHKQIQIEENRIYPISQYEAETFIADYLKHFPYRILDLVPMETVHNYLSSLEKTIGITYDDIQKQTIDAFFETPFTIITGGPGTGKTTVIKAIVDLFRHLYPSCEILCAAPTGRAAKRLAEVTDTRTATIHSLLKWDLESNTFGKNEEEPIECDLLIVDEFSMVDNWLFFNLLKASHNVRKICLIGDEDQLPSVGPGCVLRDLISSNLFSVQRLTKIYRQKDGSDVIQLAHDIREGSLNFESYCHDVAFLECNRYQIKENILTIVQNALEKGYELNDIQVLSPMYSGNAGIDLLNTTLQSAFNPKKKSKVEVSAGQFVFREGDKILQLKNQPDDDVYNGDIGFLEEIIDAKHSETHKTTLVVRFGEIYVEYNPDNWNNITLAYCISVHKSQGSEYPIVIMPFTYQQSYMLQRKLIYTAITRASKALVLLGEKGAMLKGVEILEQHPRQTTLKKRLFEEEKDPFADLKEF